MSLQQKMSSQMEDYLETIYHLCREEGVARVKTIAGKLEVTNPTVVGAIKNLKRRKLVRQERYGYVQLTPKGERMAGVISHRHAVLTNFLENILGLDHEIASGDACRIEHAVSPETVHRLRVVAELIEKDQQTKSAWQEELQRFDNSRKSGKTK